MTQKTAPTGCGCADKHLFSFLMTFFLLSASDLRAAPAAPKGAPTGAQVFPGSATAAPIFSPVLPQIRQKHPRIPILLPTFIARQQQYGLLAPEWRITQKSYSITLGDALKRPISRDYPFPAYYCVVDGQAVRTRQAPHGGKPVTLAGGIIGWFSPAGSKPTEPFAMLGWRYKTGDYSLGLTHATQAELVAMANSAIQHPVPLR